MMNVRSKVVPGVQAALSGPGYLLLGFRLLLRPGVRGFMLVPLLGNVLLYSLAAALAFYGLDSALDRWLPEGVDWLRWLLFPLLAMLLLTLAFFTFALLGNLVLAPFNGLLSERVEHSITGQADSAPDEAVAAAMWRSLRQALRRLGYVAVRLLALFALGFVPFIGVIAVPLGLLLGAWLLALEFCDNPIGNWGWDPARQRRMMREHRAGFLGFGLAAMGLSLVPVVNLAVLPAAVAGMTAYCVALRDAAAARSATPAA